MSTTTSNPRTISTEERRLIDQNLTLHQQFAQELIVNEALAAEIPYGATLVLVPDDQPDLAEINIRNGLASARRGENVYIRHVYNQHVPSDHGGAKYGPYPPQSVPNEG